MIYLSLSYCSFSSTHFSFPFVSPHSTSFSLHTACPFLLSRLPPATPFSTYLLILLFIFLPIFLFLLSCFLLHPSPLPHSIPKIFLVFPTHGLPTLSLLSSLRSYCNHCEGTFCLSFHISSRFSPSNPPSLPSRPPSYPSLYPQFHPCPISPFISSHPFIPRFHHQESQPAPPFYFPTTTAVPGHRGNPKQRRNEKCRPKVKRESSNAKDVHTRGRGSESIARLA